MATIIKNPEVEDYFVELSLDDIKSRRNGIIDLYEASRLILLKDYKIPIDLDIFSMLSGNISKIEDQGVRKRVKKLVSSRVFNDGDPKSVEDEKGGGAYEAFETNDPIRKAVYDILCNGDPELFMRASKALKSAHEAALELFHVCFPNYDYFRVIPTVRLTTTLFESIHWDNHHIPEDFQQVRIFCNLDRHPRLWHTSHNFMDYVRRLYRAHHLERFAGRDPNDLVAYICGDVLGGTKNACLDNLPRHVIAFDPGEVWFAESRFISHQIYYGERALVYMFLVSPERMLSPDRRFNGQIESLHASMANETAN